MRRQKREEKREKEKHEEETERERAKKESKKEKIKRKRRERRCVLHYLLTRRARRVLVAFSQCLYGRPASTASGEYPYVIFFS